MDFLRRTVGGGGGGGGRVLLATYTIATPQAAVDVDSLIDATYAEYRIEGRDVRTDTDNDQLRVQVFAPTVQATNYGRIVASAHSNGIGSYDFASNNDQVAGLIIPATYFDAAEPADFDLGLIDPANTARSKAIFGDARYTRNDDAATAAVSHFDCRWWGGTAAVTGVRFSLGLGLLTGTFRLYGIN